MLKHVMTVMREWIIRKINAIPIRRWHFIQIGRI